MKKIFTLLLLSLFSMPAFIHAATKIYDNSAGLKVATLTFDDKASVSVTGKTCDPANLILIDGTYYRSFKISANNEYTFTAATGEKVKKMTIHAYSNSTPASGYFQYIGTKEFGSDYSVTADKSTNGKNNNVAIAKASDKFEAEFDEPTSVVKFQCTGGQLCIVLEVEYAVVTGEILKAPVITYNKENGEVTIEAQEGASKICYTTDGTTPTSKSITYEAPFTVEDGTVIKALAVGDDVNYRSSEVTTETMLLANGEVAEITCDQFNGAFHLLCATPAVKIEYQVGSDPDWKTYGLPVTLFEEGVTKVKARATRTGWTTATASFDITVPPYVKGHEKIIIGYGSFQETSASKTLTGSIADPEGAMGMNLSMTDAEFSYGNVDLTLNGHGNEVRKSIKGSSGKEITMTIPKGITVLRVTFYNYLTGDATPAGACWAVKYGEGDTEEDWVTSAEVPDESHDKTDPASRVFKFEDGVKDKLVFRHDGVQPIFCMVVNVIYDDVEAPSREDDEEVIYSLEDGDIDIELFPAVDHHLIYIKHEKMGAAAVQSRAVAEVDHENFSKLDANAEGKYIYTVKQGEPGLLRYYSFDPNTLQKSDVKTLVFNDESTGLENVAVDGAEAEAEYYNLQGQRVLNPEKGNLYIVKRDGKATKVVL